MGLKPVQRVYQPIWTPNGNDPTYKYQRPSAERYEVLKTFCAQFKRPFSVLDIGANYAYFDVRLMEDFDCCCVMVDNKMTWPVLQANNCLDRSVVIPYHLSAKTLESLAKSEHFDVVLGLAVLHHFDDPELAYHSMRKLGWWSVFEIPGENDVGAANPEKHEMIRSLFPEEPSGYFPSHVSDSQRPFFILENEPYIFEQTMDAADRDAPVYNDYKVRCDFEESVFIKEGKETPFIPGMNLYNFQRLKGAWPKQDDIEMALEQHSDHPDFVPWNFIVGFGITPIDTEDKFA